MKQNFLFFLLLALLMSSSAAWAAKSDVVTSNTAGATVSFSSSGSYEWEWYNNKLRSTNAYVDSSTSQTTITISTSLPCEFSFDYAVSSESNYDELTITLDGSTIVNAISGNISNTYSSTLSSGSHTLVLRYTKDESVDNNDDRAYVSNMKFLTSAKVIQSGSCGDNVNYVLTDDGTLVISGNGQMEDYGDIYDEDNNHITSTVSPWFGQRFNITKVIIQSGVTSIGAEAFNQLSKLTSVTIPNSVTSIGAGAFQYCSTLTSVTIPNYVTSIGAGAFMNCSGLNSIEIPSFVTSINIYTFSGCSSLSSVTIPNSVTSIGESAFEYCSNLTSVTIPNSVTSIGAGAFQYCSGLTSVFIPNSVTTIDRWAFSYCSELTYVAIPNSVTGIGNHAFGYCPKLKTVYCRALKVPSTIANPSAIYKEFDSSPISSATLYVPAVSLTAYKSTAPWRNFGSIIPLPLVSSISINASSNTITIGNKSTLTATVLPENADNKTVTWSSSNPDIISVDAETGEIMASGIGESTITATAVDGSGVTGSCTIISVRASSYYDIKVNGIYYNLNSDTKEATATHKGFSNSYSGNVVIPEKFTLGNVVYKVTSIGYHTFWSCSDLTSISIPSSVTSIDDYAIICCTSLTSLTVDSNNPNYSSEDNVLFNKDKTILVRSSSKKGVYTIPNYVKSIAPCAFNYCTGLISITIPNSVTNIGESAFSYCTSLTSIEIPNSVEIIGDYAFQTCKKLASVTFPTSVTSPGYKMFDGCPLLPVVDNLRYAGTYLYEVVDKSVTSVKIKEGTLQIGYYAFSGCSNLSSVIIPNTVTTIYSYAFRGNYQLQSLVFPKSVTSVGYSVFSGCDNLKELTCLAETVPTAVSGAFPDPPSGTTLYVPGTSIEAYKADPEWKKWNWNTNYSKIVGLQPAHLLDGEPYTNTETKMQYDVAFQKTFPSSAAGKWNALYVPIKINVEDYADQLDFAEIYAFCATVDTNGDGSIDGDDENFLFVRPVTTGCIEPNIPYVVRPHDAKEYTIRSYDDILYAKAEGTIQFGTTEEDFTVIGLYEPFDVTANDNNYYVSSTGTLGYRTSGSVTINPNRWIMHRQPKGYGGGIDGSNNLGNEENPSAGAKEYRIITLDEDMDEATAIELINMQKSNKRVDNTIYTLDGRKVNDVKTLTNGIYIKNGKKFIVR